MAIKQTNSKTRREGDIMAFTVAQLDAEISKQEKAKKTAQEKIDKIKITTIEPLQEKIKQTEKTISKLQGLKTQFEKLEAEYNSATNG